MEKKKIGIVSFCNMNNFGSILQDYALQKALEKLNYDCNNIKKRMTFKKKIKNFLKLILNYHNYYYEYKKIKKFKKFSKNIKYKFYKKNIDKEYDNFLLGSDQLWNPYFGITNDLGFLNFTTNDKKNCFSTSFGVDKIPFKLEKYYKENISKFKNISVRETIGKDIIYNLNKRDDVEVLIDPVMLLNSKEWEEIIKKPKFYNKNKYVLVYFLGELSNNKLNEIKRFAYKNNFEIINISNICDTLHYAIGPDEFLFLIKNSEMVFTDSYHASVFSFIFDKSFCTYYRKQRGVACMNSRINTLGNIYELNNNIYNLNKKINLKHNYNYGFKRLEEEKNKGYNYLKKIFM